MARPRAALLVAMLSVTWLAMASTGVSAGDEPAGGEAPRVLLRDALEALRQRGLPIVFSSSLVPGDLEASAESVAAAGAEESLRDEALALLEPHRLTLEEGPQGTLLVVRDARRESKGTGTTRTETGV